MSGPGGLLARIKRLVMPSGDGVGERVVKGGMWVGALNVSDRLLQIILLIVMGRLLGPEALGLMGIALVAVSGLRQFSNLGLSSSLIYNREENVDDMLNTAWALQIGRGALLAGVLYLAAPFIGNGIFSEPEAVPLLRVIGFSQLFLGLRNPATVYFQKDLEFEKQFVYVLSGSVIQFVFAIWYAYTYGTVWALVLGYVISDFVRMLVSYLMHDFRPGIEFDLDHAKEIVNYGKWITATSILYFLYNEGDDIVVGALVSTTALGLYRYAYQLSNAPATEVTHVISSVTFPAYSKIQDNVRQLRNGYFQTLQVTTFISFPMSMGIIAVSPAFIAAFLGEEWLPMVLSMQILAVYGMMRSMMATIGPVFKSIGRPDLVAKFSFIRVVFLAALVPTAILYGPELSERFLGVGLSGIEMTSLVIVAVQFFPMMPLDLYFLVREIETTWWRIIREVSYPFVASLLMFAAVVAAGTAVDPALPALGVLVVQVLVGVVAYALAALVLDRGFGWGLEQNLRNVVSAVNG
ncbi:lipopolysaccharide biosynthesis protein [Halomarina ordinaria]|uniref:Lipopolysaccharide biosynthesis protein n=1 Tax=Halomarina ordinaria TaxID=3033939 RepID=A0ABD5UI05_9EURY|nr:lipopolysaccharide biosynthesis protein [Halomarina sp. PSRA2]